jgi:hypothetical protein
MTSRSDVQMTFATLPGPLSRGLRLGCGRSPNIDEAKCEAPLVRRWR